MSKSSNSSSSSSSSSSTSTTARGRLAVLTAHLTPPAAADFPAIERSCVSALVAPPGNLKGALTVVDERTGKKYEFQVSEDGTIKASEL